MSRCRISVLDDAVTAALAAIGEEPQEPKRARPDGRTPNGRAFHAVLADVIRYLKHLREAPPEGATAHVRAEHVKTESLLDCCEGQRAGAPDTDGLGEAGAARPEEPSDAPDGGHICFREGLLACEGMLCLEVHMPSWRISALGAGAQRFFEHAPWRLSPPQSLFHLVHCGDVEAVQSMQKQAEAYGVSEQTPVRLHRFHLVRAQMCFLTAASLVQALTRTDI